MNGDDHSTYAFPSTALDSAPPGSTRGVLLTVSSLVREWRSRNADDGPGAIADVSPIPGPTPRQDDMLGLLTVSLAIRTNAGVLPRSLRDLLS